MPTVDLEYKAIEQGFIEPLSGGWHKGLEHRAHHIISVTRSTPSPTPPPQVQREAEDWRLMRGRCQRGTDVWSSSVISN